MNIVENRHDEAKIQIVVLKCFKSNYLNSFIIMIVTVALKKIKLGLIDFRDFAFSIYTYFT